MKNPFGTPAGPIWKDLKAFFVAGPQPDLAVNDPQFQEVTQSEKEKEVEPCIPYLV